VDVNAVSTEPLLGEMLANDFCFLRDREGSDNEYLRVTARKTARVCLAATAVSIEREYDAAAREASALAKSADAAEQVYNECSAHR
jgi:hypothetical protein